MRKKTFDLTISISLSLLFLVGEAIAQSAQPVQSPLPTPLPFPAQIKKSVVFIQTDCLKEPTPEELSKLAPAEQENWRPQGIARLTPQQLAAMPRVSFFGTGFIVAVPTSSPKANQGFVYIVTNRHVAQPGVELGKPCKVVRQQIFMNHRESQTGTSVQLRVAQSGVLEWTFPTNDAVDLAVTPFIQSLDEWDYYWLGLNFFATQEMVDKNEIVEGDPVIFAGLFIQYAGTSRLEPVVRSGTIAMLPKDPITTTLQKLGPAYLTEAHVFGGNSGSPMFVDINKFKSPESPDYKFFGVVSGEIHESQDFSIQTSSSLNGTVAENSGISMIVPFQEVRALLLSPSLQKLRDAYTQK